MSPVQRFRSLLAQRLSRAASAPAASEAVPQPHRSRLANGLRVWVLPRPGTGTLALLLQVPVGSRHETETNNGISHFLEHMLFTGTARWNEAEVDEVIRRRGGSANARTSQEDTVIWLHLATGDLELGLNWLAEVVFRPKLADNKFLKERQVILAEKGGEFGVLERVGEWIEDAGLGWDVFRAAMHRLYPKSALLLPVIGRDRSLRRLTADQVRAFYRQHYLPNNATLVVVGDVDADETLVQAARALGDFAPGAAPARPSAPPSPPGGFDLRLRGPNLNNHGQILLGAPLPGLAHPDRYALNVLAEILDTQLTEDIRFKRGLVYGIDVGAFLYTDAGTFSVYTTADSDKFPEILAEVERRVDQAIAGELTEAQVAGAKAAIRGRLRRALEHNLDLGWWLAERSLVTPDGQLVPDAFAGIAAVTAADVARVARTYLTPERRYRAVHRPGLTPRRAAPPVAAGLMLAGLGVWYAVRRRRKGA